jgi:parallel beta-helix repeat protein
MRVRRSRQRRTNQTHEPISSLTPRAIGAGVAALAAMPAAAATFTVTNLNDSGPGTLRQAIADANAAAGADVVTFQAGLTGTITLTTGQLYILDSLDVQGPGASVITVSGNNTSRVFYMYNSSTTIDVRLAGLTITEGNDTIGAGVVDFDQNLILDAVTITGNNASSDGAGLWADGFDMTLTIQDSTISGNIAGNNGGGIYVEDTGGPMLIDNSVISGNESTNNGGGIYFYDPDDDITIRDTTISGNTAGGSGGGLALYSFDNGILTIEGSTISGNTAATGGGMYFYDADHDINITDSTISGNNATESNGGGIALYNLYANLNLNFVTIANNNAAGSGGGMFTPTGTPHFFNSIIGDNTAATDNDLGAGQSASFDLTYTLLENATGASINDLGGNILDTDPQLGTLASNGGPTETQRPALTSPVVNAADPAFVPPPSTDQRGQPRAYPTRADMGAVELVGGVIQFNPTAYNVAENGGSVTLTVVRNVGPDPATVDYTTNPGTASPGSDYTTTAGTLTFAPGDLSETFNVPILDDVAVEGSEQFTATLSNPSPDATIGAGNPATVTITDFEPGQVVLSSSTYSVNETGGFVTITVNRVNGSDGAVSVNYTTAPGTATPGPGNDYTTTSGTLNWAAGDTAPKTFNVPILDDTAAEGNEDFSVSLNTPSGATIGAPAAATVTIIDDPVGTAQFSVSSINTTEEAGSVTVTVTRTGGTEGPLTVGYSTANGTATAPSDYTPAAGSVTFPAGSAAPQTFTITLINDSINEGSEMFTANLTGANVGAPSTVTITLAASDDVAGIPTLSFFGRILFALLSGLAGFYAIVRNRFSVILVALLLSAVAAAPTLSAATPKRVRNQATTTKKNTKEEKGNKFSGTLLSVTNNGTTVVLNLSGGITVTLPTKAINVVDARHGKTTAGSLQLVTEGAHVIVKTKTDQTGAVKTAKIKVTP